jgi:hypothetical protein
MRYELTKFGEHKIKEIRDAISVLEENGFDSEELNELEPDWTIALGIFSDYDEEEEQKQNLEWAFETDNPDCIADLLEDGSIKEAEEES